MLAANRSLPRRARWAVPGGAVAAVGIVIAGSVIAHGQTTPTLPARTAAQLLAAVDSPAALPSAMTAVVQETASLGLPDLPGSSGPLSAISLLSGSHTFRIWYDGPSLVRVAVPVTMGETDLRRDGSSVWLWDSQTNQATHYILPAGATPAGPAGPATNVPTPQQVVGQILAAAGPTTIARQQNVTVAGQPAYQLSLAPKDSRSLIGHVTMAIDAKNSLPLQVQAFARGAASPAFSVGYTSLSFATPAASNFAFSPPPGARVKTVKVPAGAVLPAGLSGGLPNLPADAVPAGVQAAPLPPGSVTVRMSSGNEVVAVAAGGKPLPAAVRKQLQALLAQSLPPSVPRAQRAALLKALASGKPESVTASGSLPSGGWVAYAPLSGTTFSSPAAISEGVQVPATVGQGWLSVVVLPASAASGPQALGILSAVSSAATPVHGSWGSGRLLRTSLLSVLLISDGRVLIGAVQPSVLYADAARLR